jgi:hypothetical protein
MAFNTSPTTALTVAAAACSSNAPLMAGSPGRLQLLFPAEPTWGHSTWTPMATSLSVAKDPATLIVCGQAMHRSEARHRPLTETRPSTWVASSVPGESIQQDWMDNVSWQSIVPAPPLTTTFTCWRAWCQTGEAQPT